MDDLGIAFIGLLDGVSPSDRELYRTGTDNSTPLLTGILNSISSSPSVIYIPPGTFKLQPPIDRSPIVVRSNITLKFANGGMLNPEAGARLVIEGAIDAQLHQIFGTPAVGPVGSQIPREPVRIRSRCMSALYPEWWGAFGEFSASTAPNLSQDGRALQAAFDAAFNRWPEEPQGPTIPVILSGRYETEIPLLIDGNQVRGGVIIRGAGGVSEGGTVGIFNGRGFLNSQDPLLRIRGRVNFSIEYVSFRGSRDSWRPPGRSGDPESMINPKHCVLLEVFDSDVANPGRSDHWIGTFRRCTFFNAWQSAVKIVTPLTLETATTTQPMVRFMFEGCPIDAGQNSVGLAGEGDGGRGFYAIEQGTSDGVSVHLSSCLIGGRDVDCGIRLWGGRMYALASTFHNVPRPTALTSGGGQDIELVDPHTITPPNSPWHFVMPSLTMTQVNSQSRWLLMRDPPSTMRSPDIRRNSVLTGVSAADVNHVLPDGGIVPPVDFSILWQSLPTDGALIMVGCRMGKKIGLSPGYGPVSDIGTSFDAPLLLRGFRELPLAIATRVRRPRAVPIRR